MEAIFPRGRRKNKRIHKKRKTYVCDKKEESGACRRAKIDWHIEERVRGGEMVENCGLHIGLTKDGPRNGERAVTGHPFIRSVRHNGKTIKSDRQK